MKIIPNEEGPVIDVDIKLLEEQLLLETSRVIAPQEQKNVFTLMRKQLLHSVPVVQLTPPSDTSKYVDIISRNVKKCFSILHSPVPGSSFIEKKKSAPKQQRKEIIPAKLPASQISNKIYDSDDGNVIPVQQASRWKTSLRQRNSTGSVTKTSSYTSVVGTVRTIGNNSRKQSSDPINLPIEVPQITFRGKKGRISIDSGQMNVQQQIVDAKRKKICSQQNDNAQYVDDNGERSTVASQRMDDLPDIPEDPALDVPTALETVLDTTTIKNMAQDVDTIDPCTSKSTIRADQGIAPKVYGFPKEPTKRHGRKLVSKNRSKAKIVSIKKLPKTDIAKYVETFSNENQLSMLNASAPSQDITLTTHKSDQANPIYDLDQPLICFSDGGLIQNDYVAPAQPTLYIENDCLTLDLSAVVDAVPTSAEETDDNFIRRITQVSAFETEPMNTLAETENVRGRKRTAAYEPILNVSCQSALDMNYDNEITFAHASPMEIIGHLNEMNAAKEPLCNQLLDEQHNNEFLIDVEKISLPPLADLNQAELNPAELNAAELNAFELNAAESNAAELNAAELNTTELNAAESNAAELNPAELNAGEMIAFDLNPAELNEAQLNAAELNDVEFDVFDFNADELNVPELNAHELVASNFNACEVNVGEVNESEAIQAQFATESVFDQYECVNNIINDVQRENKDGQYFPNYGAYSPLPEVITDPSQTPREEKCIAEVIHNEELIAEAQYVDAEEGEMCPGPSMACKQNSSVFAQESGLEPEMDDSDSEDQDILSLNTSYLDSDEEKSAETTHNDTPTAKLDSEICQEEWTCTDNNAAKNNNLTLSSKALFSNLKIPRLSPQKVAQMTPQQYHNNCDAVPKTSPNKGVYSGCKLPYEPNNPKIKQPNHEEMPHCSGTRTKSIEIRQKHQLASLFYLRCLSDLLIAEVSRLPYELINRDRLTNVLLNQTLEEVDRAYLFMYNHVALFEKYFDVFCRVYATRGNRLKLLSMVSDCQRYPRGSRFLYSINNGLIHCGMDKITTCRQMLDCKSYFSHSAIDVFIDLIMKSDCTVFCDDILKFINISEYRLKKRSLAQLAEQVLRSKNILVTHTFFRCISALTAEELTAIEDCEVIKIVLRRIKNKDLLTERPKALY